MTEGRRERSPHRSPVRAASLSSDGFWRQFGNDRTNASHDPAISGPIDPVHVAWDRAGGTGRVWGPPAVVDDTVYVVNRDDGLYALSTDDGSTRWHVEMDGSSSMPAVVDESVYVGSGTGTVYALSAVDGTTRWTAETGAHIASSPAVTADTVVVGSNDRKIYAFESRDGSRRWTVETDGYAVPSPAIGDGQVYVGSYDGSLAALSIDDGASQWSVDLGAQLQSPAVANGTVYVGTQGTDVPFVALSADDGRERWRRTGQTWSNPAVVDDRVYVGSFDGSVYALATRDGTERWRYATGTTVSSAPAVVDDTVYVGSRNGTVYALSAADGSVRWTVETGGAVSDDPAVAANVVYVGSNDGRLYAITDRDGPEESNAPPSVSITVSPSDPAVGDPVTFDASRSVDYDGSIASFEWDLDDDGNVEVTGASATTTFDAPGEVTVRVRVTDDDGASATGSRTVSIGPRAQGTPTPGDPATTAAPTRSPDSPTSHPTPSPTPRPTDTPTATPTPTPVPTATAEAGYDLGAGSPTTVQPGGEPLYVITDIPGAGRDQIAVTTTGYRLVAPAVARDALFSYVWRDRAWPRDTDEQIDLTTTLRESERHDRLFGHAVDAGWDLTMMVSFGAVLGPGAALGAAAEAVFEEVEWIIQTVEQPYKRAFQSMSASLVDANTTADELAAIESYANLGTEIKEFAGAAMQAYDQGKTAATVYDDFLTSLRSTGSMTSSAKTALQGASGFFAGLGASFVVNEIESGIKAKTTIHSIGFAYATVRLPVLRALARLKPKVDNGTASPAEIVLYTRYLFIDYQMSAVAWEATGQYWERLSEGLSGAYWNVIANADSKARMNQETARTMRETAKFVIKLYGAGLQTVEGYRENLLNADLGEGGDG